MCVQLLIVVGLVAAKMIPMESRFNRLTSVDPATGCWNWLGTKNKSGYGKMTLRINTIRKYSTSHREAYKHYIGNIPIGLYVLHKCDNPPCCNPDHLYVGNNSDNQIDRYTRTKRYNRDIITGKFITTNGI